MAQEQDWFAAQRAHGNGTRPPSVSGDWFAEQRSQQPDFRVEVKALERPIEVDPDVRRATFGNHLADAFIGAMKGGGQTAVNLGRLIHLVPGVSEAVDFMYGAPVSDASFREADRVLTPTNTAQAIGKGIEQVAEVLIPSRAISSAGIKAAEWAAPKLAGMVGQTAATVTPRVGVEAAASGAMSLAQGGDPLTGAVTGGVVTAVPAVASKVAPWLKKTAVDKVTQALGARKERYKAIAERIAPEMLRRGLKGSREALKAQADDMVTRTGEAVDEALTEFAEQRVPTARVLDALEAAKAPFRRNAFNPRTGVDDHVVVFDPRPIKQLEGLQSIVRSMGKNAPVEHMVALRRAWDDVVAQAGGYAHRAGGAIGVPLKDQSEAWAKREGSQAIRKLLADEVPDLTTVNREFAFWKNLDDVVTQTLQRTQPHKKAAIAEKLGQAAGVVAGSGGGVAGSLGGAVITGKALQMLDAAINSPRWALADARMRNRIADALMSGNETELTKAIGRVVAVQGSKLPAALQSTGTR